MPYEEWREIIMEQPVLAQNYKANVRRILDDGRKPFDALVVIVHGRALTPEARNELREIEKQPSAVEHEADGLQDEVFKEFLARKKRLEIGVSILKWSVYILFIFGWTLGLASACRSGRREAADFERSSSSLKALRRWAPSGVPHPQHGFQPEQAS
jgi:hypothetical protein